MPNEDAKKIDRILGGILRTGAIASVVAFIIGLTYLIIAMPGEDPEKVVSLGEIWNSIVGVSPYGMIAAGVVVTVATPIIRVLASASMFATHDRALMCVAITTLLIIALGIAVRLIGG